MDSLSRLINAYRDDLKVTDIRVGVEQIRGAGGSSIVYGRETGQRYERPVKVRGGRRVEQLSGVEVIVALTPSPLKKLLTRVSTNCIETQIVKK